VTQLGLWLVFSIVILGMMVIDLGVLHRKAHVISLKEAGRWSVVVVLIAAAFNVWLYYTRGSEPGLMFTAGYLIELALSVDNVFVFILIFAYFNVPHVHHHRVLFWGIIGALVLRGAMIAVGWLLVERFYWILYVFGAFLILTGIRMAFHDEMDIQPESNPVLKLIRRFVPLTPNYHGDSFFTKEAAPSGKLRWVATPLFVVLVMVDIVDVIFAVDSIPAVFAITTDPFLVFTSNVFAIIGLRSLYFLLQGIIKLFHFLKLGLALVLTFVGVKMLVTFFDWHIPIGASLGAVAGILGVSIVASVFFPEKAAEFSPLEPETGEFRIDPESGVPLAQPPRPTDSGPRSSAGRAIRPRPERRP
jgi:tellurite resistance protein TerC